jgi:hypothetical protein
VKLLLLLLDKEEKLLHLGGFGVVLVVEHLLSVKLETSLCLLLVVVLLNQVQALGATV